MTKFTCFHGDSVYAQFNHWHPRIEDELIPDLYIYRKDGLWFYFDYFLQPIKPEAVPATIRLQLLLLNQP
jgi:hypothetical protein